MEIISHTVNQVDALVPATVRKTVWSMAVTVLGLQLGNVSICNNDRGYRIPTNHGQYRDLVKKYNLLCDRHKEIEQMTTAVLMYAADKSSVVDPLQKLTTTASDWILDTLEHIAVDLRVYKSLTL